MAGRPVKYATPEDLQTAIDAYFIGCDEQKKPYTITGLAMSLDLTRQGLCEYAEKGAFSDTVKKAKQRVEESVEIRLFGSSPAGSIFWMKNNAGWKDEQKVTQELTVQHKREMSEEELIDIASRSSARNT